MSFVNKFRSFVTNQGDSDSDTSNDGSIEVDDFDYSTINNCPYCHSSLQGYDCVTCNVEFVLEDDKLVERLLSQQGPRAAARRCIACDTPMTGGVLTAAWEAGGNEDAYVTCPSCGYENTF